MSAEPAGASRAGLLLALAGAVLAADQITKAWIVRSLRPGEMVAVVAGWFQIRFIVNRGGLFGVFRNLSESWRTVLFTGVPVIASVGLLVFLLRTPASQAMLRAGLSLILGGAVGNLTDRLRLGHVIDFLDVYWRDHHWPAFNVADSAICVGVGLILLDAFRGRLTPPMPPSAEPAAPLHEGR